MNDSQSQDPRIHRNTSEWYAALLVIVGSVLLVAGMAAHPSAHHADTRSFLADVSQIGVRNSLVHGGLMLVMAAVFVGLLGLSARLGWQSNRVRAAVVFHATGFGCMVAAALMNGFVVTHLALDHADATEAELASLAPVLHLCSAVGQSAAMSGIAALFIAILCWSAALFGRGRGARAVAVFGFVVAAMPLLMHLAGHVHVDAHVMGAVVLVQGLWYIAAATWVLRTRAIAAPDRG